MALISGFGNQKTTLDDNASLIINRAGYPFRILGSSFKSGLQTPLLTRPVCNFFGTVGSFRPAETRHEFYISSKAILESVGYDLSSNDAAKGLPVSLYTDGSLVCSSGWMYHWCDSGTDQNSIKILSGATTYTYEEEDSTVEETLLQAYYGSFSGSEVWLSDLDVPEYSLVSGHLWDPSDLRVLTRVTTRDSFFTSSKDLINTDDLSQTTESHQPQLLLLDSGKSAFMLDGVLTRLEVPEFSLLASSPWTVMFWGKPSTKDGPLLGSLTDGTRVVVPDIVTGSLLITDDDDLTVGSTSAFSELYDGSFHLVTLASDSAGYVKMYLDKSLVETVGPIGDITGLDCFGLPGCNWFLGITYVHSTDQATLSDIMRFYDKTAPWYALGAYWDSFDITANEFGDLLGSEEGIFGFAL